MRQLLQWTIIFPTLAWLLFFTGLIDSSWVFEILATVLLIFCVISAVHHSEIIAHRVGEPYGTIILAIAVTVIEVSIIVSLMITGGAEAVSLARDTVYSATMLILNGIVGLCLFIGGIKYHEQNFSKHSASIALVCMVSIVVLTLVFPTFTTSIKGPYYSTAQLVFVASACLIIYAFFLFAQTTRHRNYFLAHSDGESEKNNPVIIPNNILYLSLAFLLVSLGIVVLLAKTLSPAIEQIVVSNNLPKALVGIVIAAIILLPEGIAAVIAARKNQLQTSINLALGSALASIALTIPAVAIVCSALQMEIVLGLDIKSIILLALSVFIVMLSLASGRTNVVYGVVLLINLFAFIFLIIYP
jgi:Ca2+:H+ antiporter